MPSEDMAGSVSSEIASEAHRVERVLARARVVIATAALLTAFADPGRWTPEASFAVLLLAYLLYSSALLIALRTYDSSPPNLAVIVHAVDVLSAALIVLLTAGPASPFFVFFVFAVLAAAYRWGLWATLATSAAAIALFTTQASLLENAGFASRMMSSGVTPSDVFMGLFQLLVAGLLLGYLAEEDKQLRGEARTIARIMGRIQDERSLTRSLQSVARELLDTYRGKRMMVALENRDTEQLVLWTATATGHGRAPDVTVDDLESTDRDLFFFDMPASAWLVASPRYWAYWSARGAARFITLSTAGGPPETVESPMAARFVRQYPSVSMMCVSFEAGEDWHARVFLEGGSGWRTRVEDLRSLQKIVVHVGPALYNIFLVRRLRARAGAMERARVARELHDGVIQSLIGLEMRLEVASRRAADGASITADLELVTSRIREEIVSVRELMHQMRPVEVTRADLPDYLANLVDRFGRETGISARFVCDLQDVPFSPRVCRELVMILQEALVNVRKHSGASNVLVRLRLDDKHWSLLIDEDGRGFNFEGRYSHSQLDARRRGPVVIKERVRAIGGELTIDSTPGRGARLEISLPRMVHG
jgi:signal transduction histidine kinase